MAVCNTSQVVNISAPFLSQEQTFICDYNGNSRSLYFFSSLAPGVHRIPSCRMTRDILTQFICVFQYAHVSSADSLFILIFDLVAISSGIMQEKGSVDCTNLARCS